MCRRTRCSTCQKPSFAGCGLHVEQVLADVTPTDRCSCRADGVPSGPAWLRRILGS